MRWSWRRNRQKLQYGVLVHARDLRVSINDDPEGPIGRGGAYAWRRCAANTDSDALRAAVLAFESELRTCDDVRNEPADPIVVEVDRYTELNEDDEFVETAVVFYVETDEA